MQFRDLKAQYQALRPAIEENIQKVITEASFISGRQVEELEEKLAIFTGAKHCITCGNGTDALSMVLMAWNIGLNDAVFVPDFTFFATGEVVAFEGATPIFVDVDKDTFNMNPDKLEIAIQTILKEGKLTPKAIIPVDLFGLPANYPEIQKVADKYGLKILEDAAQGFGGEIIIGEKKQKACTFGTAAATSFFPAKPLGCYGDGGAIFTNDDDLADYIRSIRIHGKGSFKYDNIRIGWNSRLDTIQAAIMLPKLKAFQEYELIQVNQIARQYTMNLKKTVKTPIVPKYFNSSWAQYTIQLRNCEERDKLKDFLEIQGIPVMIYYPIPMRFQRAFKNIKIYQECPVSENLCKTVLSLPMHPYLTIEEVNFICDMIKKFFQ